MTNPNFSTKRTSFLVTHKDGKQYRWYFWRDGRNPASWMLETHDGCVRTLEKVWIDTIPKIQLIAENYGMTHCPIR